MLLERVIWGMRTLWTLVCTIWMLWCVASQAALSLQQLLQPCANRCWGAAVSRVWKFPLFSHVTAVLVLWHCTQLNKGSGEGCVTDLVAEAASCSAAVVELRALVWDWGSHCAEWQCGPQPPATQTLCWFEGTAKSLQIADLQGPFQLQSLPSYGAWLFWAVYCYLQS